MMGTVEMATSALVSLGQEKPRPGMKNQIHIHINFPLCWRDRTHASGRPGLVEHLCTVVGFWPRVCHAGRGKSSGNSKPSTGLWSSSVIEKSRAVLRLDLSLRQPPIHSTPPELRSQVSDSGGATANAIRKKSCGVCASSGRRQ